MNGLEKKYPLKGFMDTHLHTAPDSIPRKHTDFDAARKAQCEKMRAIVIKSHIEPTSGRALQAQKETNFKVFGGVTLNNSVGGYNVDAVQASATLGGKVVWLPTISRDDTDLALKDNWEKLEEIINIILENDMILATGHLKIEDIFQVIDQANSMGLLKIIINHPLTRVVGADIQEQREMSRKAYMEHCYVACLPRHDKLDPLQIAEAIKEIGPCRCILASDLGQKHNIEPTLGFKRFISMMMGYGISENEIRRMCLINPYKLFF
jgi:Family of unknown function (DUF6282)